jgi:hypothetical protein
MTKYSLITTWKNLTLPGRLFFGFITLFLISCTAVSCISSVVIFFLPTPTQPAQATATFTLAPAFTISPSPTVQTDLTSSPGPSLTPLATRALYASSTPPIYLITPTNTFLPFPLPTATSTPTRIPRNKSVCSCRIDKYNCENFLKQAQAQACFNFCFSLGAGDIHQLDPDHDGIACNGLP